MQKRKRKKINILKTFFALSLSLPNFVESQIYCIIQNLNSKFEFKINLNSFLLFRVRETERTCPTENRKTKPELENRRRRDPSQDKSELK